MCIKWNCERNRRIFVRSTADLHAVRRGSTAGHRRPIGRPFHRGRLSDRAGSGGSSSAEPRRTWHAHRNGLRTVSISRTHRPALPELRDDDELLMVRARQPDRELVRSADGHAACAAHRRRRLDRRLRCAHGPTGASFDQVDSIAVLSDPASQSGGHRVGMEDVHPSQRNRWLEMSVHAEDEA
jgi:hypothetical protein